MTLQGWLLIGTLIIYYGYTSIESLRRYNEQKKIAKEENEKTRQAYKDALREVLLEIAKEETKK